jgi:hypothetical protein
MNIATKRATALRCYAERVLDDEWVDIVADRVSNVYTWNHDAFQALLGICVDPPLCVYFELSALSPTRLRIQYLTQARDADESVEPTHYLLQQQHARTTTCEIDAPQTEEWRLLMALMYAEQIQSDRLADVDEKTLDHIELVLAHHCLSKTFGTCPTDWDLVDGHRVRQFSDTEYFTHLTGIRLPNKAGHERHISLTIWADDKDATTPDGTPKFQIEFVYHHFQSVLSMNGEPSDADAASGAYAPDVNHRTTFVASDKSAKFMNEAHAAMLVVRRHAVATQIDT